MPHGIRPSFPDWAAEETDHPRKVVEASLAHTVRNQVEVACRHTGLFERRHRPIGDWSSNLAVERDPEARPIR